MNSQNNKFEEDEAWIEMIRLCTHDLHSSNKLNDVRVLYFYLGYYYFISWNILPA